MDNLYTNKITLGNMQGIVADDFQGGGNVPPLDSDISEGTDVTAESDTGGNVQTDAIKKTGGETDNGDDSENNNTLLYILLGGLALFLLRKKL